MKEYLVKRIEEDRYDTMKMLNELAEAGWTLVCSYAKNNEYLVFVREKSCCKTCGK
jgi:hypothetical protein